MIVFILVMGFPPYKCIDDHWYNLTKDWDQYWMSITRASGICPSPSFRTLIQALLEIDPDKRISLSDIEFTEWFNG